jgi:hypothetical protein
VKTQTSSPTLPGQIVLFGSGETSPSGRKVFEHILRQLPPSPRIALLETPAGFELNSAAVIQRVADFLQHHLQNFHPQSTLIAARQRGTLCSPDSAQVAAPLLQADLIFAGPGSPTYAASQLQDSLTWHYLVARHRLGASLVLASAAVIAASAWVLPVYEIYKAGHDLHWLPGLDLFGPFGLPAAFIPHWNNADGGEELDTSHCFMGRSRFEALCALLPTGMNVVGIDEKTALLLDIQGETGRVMGPGSVTIFKTAGRGEPSPAPRVVPGGEQFHLADVLPLSLPHPHTGIPPEIWSKAVQAAREPQAEELPPEAVLRLVEAREICRQEKDWAEADRLREAILELGWKVVDGPDGPSLSSAGSTPAPENLPSCFRL